MDLVTGAMGSLLFKLGELLKDEYKLHKGVKKNIASLSRELVSMRAALIRVAEVPPDQLDEQVRLWAKDVRDLSYDMEDVIDSFLVRVEGSSSSTEPPAAARYDGFRSLMEKMANLFRKGKARRQIAHAIEEVKDHVQEVAALRERYRVDDIVVADVEEASAAATLDLLLSALYGNMTDLVGVDEPRDELVRSLSEDPEDGVKIVSIVGFGGVGKTSLARAVHDILEPRFDCTAFVSVSQKPQIGRILKNMFDQLSEKDANTNDPWDKIQLINKLRKFLENKRYLIVIDDIWNIQSWKTIKYVFPENKLASRIITTTRDFDIAKQIGGSYNLNPLTMESSKKLFYGRLFGSEEKCPEDLAEVTMKILKKCGGIPLAIMALAGLLLSVASRQWDVVSDSIGSGLGDSPSVRNMRTILSLSYYYLPSHLRTCLLYLSIYPEDYEIPRDDLIWKWIAEGFVTHENKRVFLYDVGNGYFSELINRGMIQPCVDYRGDVTSCRLHDMVLDLICSLSIEENFVTILNHIEGYHASLQSMSSVRRLSLQHSKEDDDETTAAITSMSKSQVRSVTTFPPGSNLMPPLCSFGVVRVLDLSGCCLGRSSHLNLSNVGNLLHLRYLGLAGTYICELPVEIGKLQFLQTLDVRNNSGLKELPSIVYKLKRLMCLYVNGYDMSTLPDGLGNLTSMEVLKKICASMNNVKELRNLSSLRELKIKFEQDMGLEYGGALVESLCKLNNIQSLVIRGYFPSMDLLGEQWVPPPHLRTFESLKCGLFTAMPAWIRRNPSLLSDLSELAVGFKEVRDEDLRILGSLPGLRRLWLMSAQQMARAPRVGGDDGFRCLTTFAFYCDCESPRQIAFQQGALPRVEAIIFNFGVRTAMDDGAGGFDFGLGNLPSLRQSIVGIERDGATVADVKEAAVALRREANGHPNRPTLTVDIRPRIQPNELQNSNEMIDRDDELVGEPRKFWEKFRKFREQTRPDHPNPAI